MLMTISSRQFTMRNKVPFVYFLDEMTTVNIKNFETLPSVLREYLCAFVLLTQSGSKVENQYGRLDRSSVEAKEQMRMYGIPASVILAQAILESSNGQSQLSRECNNHFGIKATASPWPNWEISPNAVSPN